MGKRPGISDGGTMKCEGRRLRGVVSEEQIRRGRGVIELAEAKCRADGITIPRKPAEGVLGGIRIVEGGEDHRAAERFGFKDVDECG